ncbi:MAG: glycosyltransferase [Rhodoluna sp.]|nr:glycosyltransferase [Rhodoluna sp.]
MTETIASLVSSDGKVIRTSTGSSLASAISALNIEPDPTNWVWLNYSNSTPEPGALEALLECASRSSELTGIIGPKLVATQDPRTITQLGLTLTPFGDAFSPVSEIFDQGQHDRPGDVLAVGTAGMLVRTTVLAELGGFDENAPELAADIDFSIRARMAGNRVVVEPKARVAYDGKAAELGGSMKLELRKASIHLRMVYSPMWSVLLYWLALIPLGFLRAVYRIAQKRPDRIWAEIYSAFWGFFTAPKRLASRKLLPSSANVTLAGLKPLRATWQEVRAAARASADRDEAQQNLAAFARGASEETPAKSFSSALGWVFVLLLAIASWQLFPTNVAVTGGNALPLSAQLGDLFARAGASWQPIADGYFAPSDPFNWVLLLLGSLTFWSPLLSIGLLLFLARPIAFVGAWRVAGLFTKKAWLRNVVATGFALWPSLTTAISGARVADVVAAVTLPWLVLAIARAAGLGRVGSARSNRQTWSWVALAGLLLAVVGASAPNLLVLVLVGLAVVASMRIRRLGYLFWIPLPLGAIFAPYAYYLIVKVGAPAAVIADPSLAKGVARLSNLELLVGGSLLASAYVLAALFALLTKRWAFSLALWFFGLLLTAAAWLTQQLSFPSADGAGSNVSGSPLALLSAAALVVAVLVVLAFDSLERRWLLRLAGSALVLLGLLPLAFTAATASPSFTTNDGRVVPWLLVSQAESDARLLVISADGDTYTAKWLSIRGQHLEDASTAYRFELSRLASTEPYRDVAKLSGAMISANGVDISAELASTKVRYVLVPNNKTAANQEIGSSLDSVPQLESAGVTEFGRLWRVKEQPALKLTQHSVWSITKGIQVAILSAFVLLAIPSRSRRNSAGEAQIFVDGEDSDV